MELRHLEHFLAVAEEASFTRAAQRVHVVQSALSVSVRTLERDLGARLFDRTTHHVSLTDEGRALLVEARRTLASAEAARDAVAAVQGGMRGTVRVGIMRSLAVVDLAALLTRYHRERPQVRIEPSTAEGGSAELAEAVVEGGLDLAFTAMPGDYPPGLDVTLLGGEPLDVACPDDHPFTRRDTVDLAELDGQRFVELPRGWGTRLSVDQLFLRHGITREIAVEVADLVIVGELVRAGFGLTFLTASLAGPARGVRLVPVRPYAEFRVSLITPSDRPLPAAARAFVELTREMYPARSGAGQGDGHGTLRPGP